MFITNVSSKREITCEVIKIAGEITNTLANGKQVVFDCSDFTY